MARVGLEEAATLTGRSKSTLLRHIRAGKLAATKGRGGSWQIDKGDLARVYGASPEPSESKRVSAPERAKKLSCLQDRIRELEAALAKGEKGQDEDAAARAQAERSAERVRELEAEMASRVRGLEADLAERHAEVTLERSRRERLTRELESARRLAGHRNRETPPYAGPDPVLRVLTRFADRWRDWWEGPV